MCVSMFTPLTWLAACTAGVLYVATARPGGAVRGAACDRYGGGGTAADKCVAYEAGLLYRQPLHKRPQCVLVAAGWAERALGLSFTCDLLP